LYFVSTTAVVLLNTTNKETTFLVYCSLSRSRREPARVRRQSSQDSNCILVEYIQEFKTAKRRMLGFPRMIAMMILNFIPLSISQINQIEKGTVELMRRSRIFKR
jgi:hypothetical protein